MKYRKLYFAKKVETEDTVTVIPEGHGKILIDGKLDEPFWKNIIGINDKILYKEVVSTNTEISGKENPVVAIISITTIDDNML